MQIKSKSGRIFEIPNDADQAKIEAGIAADNDTYSLSNEEFLQLKPVRGRPIGSKAAQTKESISMRVDTEVLQYFKAQGRGWQTRMNQALKIYISEQKS